MNLEEFKEIPNTGRYMISCAGDVWDLYTKSRVSRMINNGYVCVNIRYEDKRALEKVHRLVYKVYIGELSSTDKIIHIDGDKENNHFSNLSLKSKQHREPTYMELCIRDRSRLKTTKEIARSVWYNMIDRCSNTNNENYGAYGARGIKVCDDWKDQSVFIDWYVRNSIHGWAMDKDLLSANNTIYSPETCVFIPHGLNSLVAKVSNPKIKYRKRSKDFVLETSVNNSYMTFVGNTADECKEQYRLIRQMQIEKMIWLMKEYVAKLPNSPEIDNRVLEKLYELTA